MFSTKCTDSFTEQIFIYLLCLTHYAKCLKHEVEKTQYCPCPQRAHNLERQPPSLTNNVKYRREKRVSQGCLEVSEGFTKEIGLKGMLKA